MEKQDLFDHSPVRIFDKVTDGGLKTGEIGLVTSKKGLGKTSILVQFGIDALLAGKQLVHVSFDQHSANVITWYESIFTEVAKKKNLNNVSELKDSLFRDRIILNFNQESFTLPKVIKTLKALKEGGTNVAAIVIDGADLEKVSADDMKAVKDFVKSENLTAWFSCTSESDTISAVPQALQADFETVIHLTPKADGVYVSIVKSHEKAETPCAIKLDSKSLLMIQK
jgi:KaiC/GvpD/RAD55 family RecA-like ATPase